MAESPLRRFERSEKLWRGVPLKAGRGDSNGGACRRRRRRAVSRGAYEFGARKANKRISDRQDESLPLRQFVLFAKL